MLLAWMLDSHVLLIHVQCLFTGKLFCVIFQVKKQEIDKYEKKKKKKKMKRDHLL